MSRAGAVTQDNREGLPPSHLNPRSLVHTREARPPEQVRVSDTIFVIVPVFNRREFTQSCLRSLAPQVGRFKVVVVDDGSTDGTSEMVRSEFPEVQLLRGDGNLWWSGATNLGVQYALSKGGECDLVLTLNDDTEIPPGYLDTMLSFAGAHPRALVGSVSLDLGDRDTILDGGVCVNWVTAKFSALNRSKSYRVVRSTVSRAQPVDLLSGRGTLIPLSVFRQVGLFDATALPQYAADYELARRAHRAGFKLYVDYDAILWSRRNATGLNNQARSLSWREWFSSFNSLKSANRLVTRYRFAARACPKWLLPSFFALDVARVTVSSLTRQLWPSSQ